MYCQKCGREVDMSGTFCAWCGAGFKEFPPVPLISVGVSKTAVNPTPAEVGAKPSNAIAGVPTKIVKVGFILSVVIPVTGFALGYFALSGLPPAECGFVTGALVYLSSLITGKVIGWMVK